MSWQKGTEVRVDADVEWPTTNAPCSRWFTTGSGFFSTEEGSKGYHWIELRNFKGAVIDEIVSAEELESLNMQDWVGQMPPATGLEEGGQGADR